MSNTHNHSVDSNTPIRGNTMFRVAALSACATLAAGHGAVVNPP